MLYRLGYFVLGAELVKTGEVTPEDIAHAKKTGYRDVPRLRPAFDAVLIDPNEDPGPIADAV